MPTSLPTLAAPAAPKTARCVRAADSSHGMEVGMALCSSTTAGVHRLLSLPAAGARQELRLSVLRPWVPRMRGAHLSGSASQYYAGRHMTRRRPPMMLVIATRACACGSALAQLLGGSGLLTSCCPPGGAARGAAGLGDGDRGQQHRRLLHHGGHGEHAACAGARVSRGKDTMQNGVGQQRMRCAPSTAPRSAPGVVATGSLGRAAGPCRPLQQTCKSLAYLRAASSCLSAEGAMLPCSFVRSSVAHPSGNLHCSSAAAWA